MTVQNLPPRRKPACKLAFHVERGPPWLTVALRGEARFDQAEVISAQLLRIPLDAYSLVVFDLAELTSLSSLALGALVAYRRGLCRRGDPPGPGAASRRNRPPTHPLAAPKKISPGVAHFGPQRGTVKQRRKRARARSSPEPTKPLPEPRRR